MFSNLTLPKCFTPVMGQKVNLMYRVSSVVAQYCLLTSKQMFRHSIDSLYSWVVSQYVCHASEGSTGGFWKMLQYLPDIITTSGRDNAITLGSNTLALGSYALTGPNVEKNYRATIQVETETLL